MSWSSPSKQSNRTSPPITAKKGQRDKLFFTVIEPPTVAYYIMGRTMLLNQTEGTTHKPKNWSTITCPCCGFSFPPKKFSPPMKQILYPVRTISGGGRARGFHVQEYFTWGALPRFRQSAIWNNLLCLYTRLGSAYDNFYRVLGFLSPEIKKLLQEIQKGYAGAYQPNPFDNYAAAYGPTSMAQDIVDSYTKDDISDAYSTSLSSASTWRFAK